MAKQALGRIGAACPRLSCKKWNYLQAAACSFPDIPQTASPPAASHSTSPAALRAAPATLSTHTFAASRAHAPASTPASCAEPHAARQRSRTCSSARTHAFQAAAREAAAARLTRPACCAGEPTLAHGATDVCATAAPAGTPRASSSASGSGPGAVQAATMTGSRMPRKLWWKVSTARQRTRGSRCAAGQTGWRGPEGKSWLGGGEHCRSLVCRRRCHRLHRKRQCSALSWQHACCHMQDAQACMWQQPAEPRLTRHVRRVRCHGRRQRRRQLCPALHEAPERGQAALRQRVLQQAGAAEGGVV